MKCILRIITTAVDDFFFDEEDDDECIKRMCVSFFCTKNKGFYKKKYLIK